MNFISLTQGNSNKWELLIDFGEYSQTFYFTEKPTRIEGMRMVLEWKLRGDALEIKRNIQVLRNRRIQDKIDSMTEAEKDTFSNT